MWCVAGVGYYGGVLEGGDVVGCWGGMMRWGAGVVTRPLSTFAGCSYSLPANLAERFLRCSS